MSKIVTGRIIRTERVRTSSMGNPTFDVTFDDGSTYRTMTNASLAYEVQNRELRVKAHTYALTRAGRLSHRVD